MRTKLAIAALVAGVAAAVAPIAPASAQCVQIEGVPGCLPLCPRFLPGDCTA